MKRDDARLDEAARLIAAHLGGADEIGAARWLLQDPRNREAYQRVASAWDLSDKVAETPAILALRRGSHQAISSRPRFDWARLRLPAVSGMAMAAASLAAFLLLPQLMRPTESDATHQVQTVRVATAAGERRTVTAPDGSKILLDGRTKISIAYADDARRVLLEGGRAYFSVRHDASRPFTVAAGEGEIVDLGTRFTVDLNHDRVKVALLEGKVELRSARGSRLTMKPGQEAVVARSAPVVRLASVRIGDPLDWTRGTITLDEMPLPEAASLLSRYTRRPIRIADDPSLQSKAVSGVFMTSNADSFAQALASALSLKASAQPDGSQILAKK